MSPSEERHRRARQARQPSSEAVRRAASLLLKWYETRGRAFPWRDPEATEYRVVVAELLLQRTRAENVASKVNSFTEQFPTWESIADADPDDFRTRLTPFGLWERRARSISSLAKALCGRNGRLPDSRSDLEALPGIGQYMASAILVYVHGHSEPLIDVNMVRLLERLFGPRDLADIRFDPYIQTLARRLVEADDPRHINWAVLDFGATVCKARRPDCGRCPLAADCRWYREHPD